MERRQAEKRYHAALKAERAAQDGTEGAYLAAKAALDTARRELVAAEIARPTASERRNLANELRLRNRGLDF